VGWFERVPHRPARAHSSATARIRSAVACRPAPERRSGDLPESVGAPKASAAHHVAAEPSVSSAVRWASSAAVVAAA
jgi:hypothetical protein